MAETLELINAIEPLRRLGVEVVDYSPNKLTVKVPLEGNANHFGAMYAGVIFSLAEFPFGALFVQRIPLTEMVPTVGEMSIRFMSPVISDLFASIEISDDEWDQIRSEVATKGKAKIIRELKLTDAEGTVKAVATGTYFALPGLQ